MKLNETSLSKIHDCNSLLNVVAIEAAKESPYEFIITHGHRSVDEQKKLYAKGRTEDGKKITNCDGVKNKSKHNYVPSRAFDIAIKIDDQITWDEKYYIEMGKHIKAIALKYNISLKWGGDFKKIKDYPHYEI